MRNDFTKIKPRSPQDFIWKKVIRKIKIKKMKMIFIILYLLICLALGFLFLLLGFFTGIFFRIIL